MRTRFQARHSAQRHQRGVVVVLVAVGMLAMLLMAGLALDGGHLFLNKTRLQNAADAAALSAAKTLDDTKGNTDLATAAARAAFTGNADAAGNAELADAWGAGAGDLTVDVQYSATLRPFTPGAVAGPYVRVVASEYRLPAWLIRLANMADKTLGASAVAGPSPRLDQFACNLAPMLVCGDPADPPADEDDDQAWGYSYDAPDVLKTAASGHWEGTPGPGNFQLVRFDGSGAAVVRENLAGGWEGCVNVEDSVETEPGNSVGPVAQGLNTRFGDYDGPMRGSSAQYPPDVIVDAPNQQLVAGDDPVTGEDTVQIGNQVVTIDNINDIAGGAIYTYSEYEADRSNPAAYDHDPETGDPKGAFERRLVSIPIGDCSETVNGQGDVPVLGFACFFLLQPARQQGNEAHVFGQFVRECTVNGEPGQTPGTGPGPYRIQLYDDPDSASS